MEKKEEEEGEWGKEGAARSLSIRATFSLKCHPREWHGTDMVKIHGAMEVTWKRHGNRWRFINKEGKRPAQEGKGWNPTNFCIFSALSTQMLYFSYQPSDNIHEQYLWQQNQPMVWLSVQQLQCSKTQRATLFGITIKKSRLQSYAIWSTLAMLPYDKVKNQLYQKRRGIKECWHHHKIINVSTATKALFAARFKSNPSVPSSFRLS